MSAANGHIDIVRKLLENGADANSANAERNSPLHFACLLGHTAVVSMLLSYGALPTATNNYDRTPIDEAYSCNHNEVITIINDFVDKKGGVGSNADVCDDDVEEGDVEEVIVCNAQNKSQ